MLLLFLSLGLLTSNVQSEKQGVDVTCENQSVVPGQNHNLTCRVEYRDVDQNNLGCKTTNYFWKHKSKSPIRNCDCTKDCNTTITTNTYFCEIKNVTKADEGNYTFTIITNCGNGHGTLNVSVTWRNEKPELFKGGSSRHISPLSSLFWVFYCFSSLLVMAED